MDLRNLTKDQLEVAMLGLGGMVEVMGQDTNWSPKVWNAIHEMSKYVPPESDVCKRFPDVNERAEHFEANIIGTCEALTQAAKEMGFPRREPLSN